MTEDKQKICSLILKALRETKDRYRIISIEYCREKELVYIEDAPGHYKVIDANGSGMKMIRDIIKVA